jgi:Ca-activated chloride channel homolog
VTAGIDFGTIRFGEPEYLWLLAAPAALFLVWLWRAAVRRRDGERLRRHRTLPVRERFPIVGGLLFWLCLVLATALTIVALARPRAAVSFVRTAGIDLVVLQDGSASMRVEDVRGNRWRRSMQFLRMLGESLRWKDDRLAMAAFAHIAAPEFRLTKDPNTFLFFLDHLEQNSPFPIQDDTTWDTNIELGIYWGLRLVEKDEELHGRSPNAKTFVLVSDGQAWSGAVARSLRVAVARNIPLYVVGVGTTTGGPIPVPATIKQDAETAPGPIRASLDRASLATIASAGNGEYFELDRESDREIATRIIDATRRRAGSRGVEETAEDLYWRFLLAAAAFVLVGIVFLRERAELWLQLAGAAASLTIVWILTAR